jgi:hypothetical protein
MEERSQAAHVELVDGRARMSVLRIMSPRRALSRHALLSLTASGLFCIAIAITCASPARAFCRLTTKMPLPGDNCSQEGIGLAWQRQCISFSVMARQDPNPPLEQIRNVADSSFQTWNAVQCNSRALGLSLAQTEELGRCGQPEYNTHEPNANTIIFVKDWAARELPENAFGLTLVWHNPDTGEIYDADMQLNETLGTITICGASCPSGSSDVDLQNVMTHEAGHFLGLGHSNVRSATMSASASVGETSKRVLAPDDRQGLCSIYGSLASISCEMKDYTPNHGFSADCAPAAGSATTHNSLGCSIAGAGEDRSSPARGLPWFVAALYLIGRARTRASRARPSPTKR